MKEKSKYTMLSNLRYLLGELKNFNFASVLISFAGIPAKVLVSVSAIYVPKLVLDAIQNQAAPVEFLWIVVFTMLIIAVTSIIDLFSNNTVQHSTNSFVMTYMTQKWLNKVTDMDYDMFSSESGKQKAEKARVSMEGTARAGVGSYFPRLVTLLTNLAGFVSYSVILFTLHPLIIPLLIVCYIISMLFTMRMEKKKQLMKEDMAKTNRRLNYMAYRTRGLQIGKDIRLYAMTDWLREMANKAKNEKITLNKKSANWQFSLNILNGLLVFIRNGAAYAYLIYLILSAQLTIGEFALYFAAISGLGEWLTQLTANIGVLTEANNYVTDFRDFMDIPDKMNKAAKVLPPSPEETVDIRLENISFSYDKTQGNVLENINLHINPGEKIAIVGENGAGKTTLIKLISGLIRADEGQVLINGSDVSKYARNDYYNIFSAVFQDSDLLPVSIADNIALNVDGEKDLGRIEECIALAGLKDKIESLPQGANTNLVKQISENGTELSGGEKQKLLLARALYKKASIMILDEPTAALDSIAENEIYLKFNDLVKNKTALFISHRLSSTRFCDRIILISDARIAEVGTHDELIALNGKYAEIYGIQSQYYNKGVR